MKKVLILLALMMFVGMPVLAQDKPKEEPKKAAAETVDAWALYKKKGRTWTHKSTTKMSGMDDMISYVKWEITEVSETECKYTMTMLDKDKKETFSQKDQVMKFETAKSTDGKTPETKAPEMTEEKCKVEAGEYDCMKYTMESAGTKTTSWMHKQYTSLVVKSHSKSDAYESVYELVEFKD